MAGAPKRSWAQVDADVQAALTVKGGEHDAATRGNLVDLLRFCRHEDVVPPFVEPGYWPTFLVSWGEQSALSIEVFDDRYELWRPFNGPSDVEYVPHLPGSPMPERLEIALRAAFSAS